MKFSFFFSMFITYIVSGFSCTNILVTKGASQTGSVIVAHENDDEVGDNRIVYVPAKHHRKGAQKPVFRHTSAYPRYVGHSRGPQYNTDGPKTKPIGYVDQVEHTFAYFDGNYGVCNEHQLSFGEATTAAYVYTEPNEERILDSGELSRIALERCTKAKEAVLLMGAMAEKYGYYGWGEVLLVGDTDEGWVFEICSPPSKKGAIWVAKKVPDGEVFVNGNEFRIREIKLDDPDILYSSNLFQIAKEEKWIKEGDTLDWLKVVSPGEYNHPYYALRRVWSLQNKISPSLKLSPWVENGYTKAYPFSIKPDKKLSVPDVFALYRDHYEGTEFDMTKGLSSGPFGSPNRYVSDYDLSYNQPDKNVDLPLKGAWERPISVFYAGYVHVCESRKDLPDEIGGVCWIGLDAPYTNCFMPVYVGVNDIPLDIQIGNPNVFDEKGAWWPFNFVANWANLKYSYMKEDIIKVQSRFENEELQNQAKVEAEALALYKNNPLEAKIYLTDYCDQNVKKVLKEWWALSKFLIVKYNDGYINTPKMATSVGYPQEWLDEVDYDKGPTTYAKPK